VIQGHALADDLVVIEAGVPSAVAAAPRAIRTPNTFFLLKLRLISLETRLKSTCGSGLGEVNPSQEVVAAQA